MSTPITRFTSQLVLNRLATRESPLSTPESERFPGVLLFADVSGSTPLAESLCQHGPEGAEKMLELLNDCFARVIDRIEARGGDILKFAGDGVVALWREDELGARQATLRAAWCAIELQKALLEQSRLHGVVLSMRVTITAGEVLVAHLGGVLGRWELLVSGAPMTQLHQVLPLTRPGEVTLSRDAWLPIAHLCRVQPIESGSDREPLGVQLVTLLAELPLLLPSRQPAVEACEQSVQAYVPAPLRSRLAQLPLAWIAERRTATVLFLHLPGLEALMEYNLDLAQEIMQAAQRCVYREEGTILRLTVDEKGVMLTAAFGLAPLAHADDPLRGVRAALALQLQLDAVGQPSSIGVCTGMVVCGCVGSDRRCEYTVVGDVVNRAARLMMASEAVLVDRATWLRTQQVVDYEEGLLLRLKGFGTPVEAHAPTGMACGAADGVHMHRVQRFELACQAGAHELLSQSAESALLGWLDRVPLAQLLLLKIVCSMDMAVDAYTLAAVFPIHPDASKVPSMLDALVRRGLLVRALWGGRAVFQPSSEAARAAVASTLTAKQIELVHTAVLDWSERLSVKERRAYEGLIRLHLGAWGPLGEACLLDGEVADRTPEHVAERSRQSVPSQGAGLPRPITSFQSLW